jgi:Transposase DDE domain
VYELQQQGRLLPSGKQRNRAGQMSISEMVTIVIYFHLSGYKCFKHLYLQRIAGWHKREFGFAALTGPRLHSYNRFVQLMPSLLLPCAMLIHVLRGEETGVYFMDATSLSVCHNRRINRNKVFAGLAERGKSSMGWFYGFKLHMVINHHGQIMAVKITKGNVDDRVPASEITKGLQGVIAADKGYISKKLFHELYRKGLKIITGIRKTMKNILMPFAEKAILRKRFFIETQFDILKNVMTAQHTRHQSPISFLVNTAQHTRHQSPISFLVNTAQHTRHQSPISFLVNTAQHTRHQSPISFLVNLTAAIIAHQITHPMQKLPTLIQNSG